MIIKKILLRDYKPLFCGSKIHLFEAAFVKKVQVIIGQNGSGKSAILRELTPLPATRTDYGKDGLKIIDIEHGGIEYTLTSDFQEAKAHSFLRDRIELNPSGTTDIQTELVIKHFGLSALMLAIFDMKKNLCNMTPRERKEFLLNTHPSNIEFLLEKHKQVASGVRSFRTNLKMLQERSISLKASILKPDDLQRLNDSRTLYEQGGTIYDRLIYATTHEIDSWSSKIQPPIIRVEELHSRIQSVCEPLMVKIRELYKQHPELFKNDQEPKFLQYKYKTDIDYQVNKLDDTKTKIMDIRTRLEANEQKLKDNSKSAIEQLALEITSLQSTLSKLEYDERIPVVSTEDIIYIRDSLWDKCHNWIMALDISSKLIPSSAIKTIQTTVNHYKQLIVQADNRAYNCNKRIGELQSQLEYHKNKEYPKVCTLNCRLKEGYQNIVGRLQDELDEHIKERDIANRESLMYQTKNRVIINKCSVVFSNFQVLTNLEDTLSWYHWKDYILDNRPLIKVLNSNKFDIINRLNKLITNSEAYHQIKSIDTTLESLKFKHSALVDVQAPTVETLEKSIELDKLSLQSHIDEYENISKQLELLKDKLSKTSELAKYRDDVINLKEFYDHHAKQVVIQRHIEYHKMLRDEFTQCRNHISEQLSALKRTLSEQDSLLTRLHDEIELSINDITSKLELWTGVERALSPLTGIPHKYMTRYVNSLLELANLYISAVWSHELELVYLNEDLLKFEFPFTVKGGGTVKDINLGSKSQQEMVHIALTMSILNRHNILSMYPLKLDEPDSGFSHGHRTNLLQMLGNQMANGNVSQLFLVNHHFPGYTALDADTIVLSEEDTILPTQYNEHVTIEL